MKRRRQKKSKAPLFFVVLLTLAAVICYLVYVKRVKIPDVHALNKIQKVVQVGTPTEKKSPRAAFDEIGGLPKSVKETVILENTGYATGYSEDLMDPLWSAYYCGPDAVYTVASRSQFAFSADPRIPEEFRVTTDDYKRPAGSTPTYDRGHMAPNYAIASRYGEQAQSETFLMTNIAPQRSSLNQQTWRYIEEEIASTYAPEFNGVWVIVGPVFIKSILHYNDKAAMPDGFFCIVVDRNGLTGKLDALAMYLRQNVSGNHSPKEFETTIRAIEEHTGLDFFSALPDDEENALETTPAGSAWHVDTPLVNKK